MVLNGASCDSLSAVTGQQAVHEVIEVIITVVLRLAPSSFPSPQGHRVRGVRR